MPLGGQPYCKTIHHHHHQSRNSQPVFAMVLCATVLRGIPNHPLNLLQPSVVFHIETSHLICKANQMTDFHMKYSNKV